MDFLNSVIDFFNQTLAFINTGIYDLMVKIFAQLVIWSTVAMFKFKLWMITFAWDTASQIMSDLNLSSYISNAFSSLDSEVLDVVIFFRIPDFVNITTTALITRYILNMIGL